MIVEAASPLNGLKTCHGAATPMNGFKTCREAVTSMNGMTTCQEAATPINGMKTCQSGSCSAMTGNQQCQAQVIKPTMKKYPEQLTLDEIQVTSPCLHEDMNEAIEACLKAQRTYSKMTIAQRKKIIQAIRDVGHEFAEDFALSAFCETGRGRYEDKLAKQFLACDATPGMEDLVPKCYTGDCGLTTIDLAPFGVIGSVTPVTNPTATVINNSITILCGGNGVVFNAHPAARRCTTRAIAVVNQAIVEAGGPCCLVASVIVPTIPSGVTLMSHPKTSANLITGGPAVVKLALSSGKKSFCAGPGNPPVIVDSSADVKLAAKGIYNGASFDNNMICSDEKEIFCVEELADSLIAELKNLGAFILTPEQTEALTAICIPEERGDYKHGHVNRDLVGQHACVLLAKIGVEATEDCRLVICEVPESHPLVWTEQLMPIIPIVRVPTFQKALELAYRAEYDFKHTSSIYSTNLDNITEMGKQMNTSLFIINGSNNCGLAAGGEGFVSFSIAGSTGEGMTRPSTFVRERRMVCVNALRCI